ncbi:hypothetical protein PHMEG_00020764 [Phytophthora megakarya]|uniref:Uncharacterized protein n=1 Tax=Phytophthora megakarya TaxID=4795 RepID=A0A225VN24_9STRA|nr:hypothetical protein PHMEG_00020764 [Phytophthora megakarya]
MINDILKRRGRKTKRDTSAKQSHSHDNCRRRDSGRNEDSRGSYRRDNPHRDDRRRDESPYRPRITLADAPSDLVTALNEISVGAHTSQSGQYDRGYETNEDSLGDGDHRNDDGGSEYDYAVDEEKGLVEAANEHERRAAAEGTIARSDNRRTKDDATKKITLATDDNSTGPAQRCKQVHDADKCEAFNELASLLWSKVDKNDLTPMLQNVVYGNRELGIVNTTEIVEKNGGNLGERKTDGSNALEHDGYLTEALASSADPNRPPPGNLARTAGLLPGEI